MKPWLLSCLLIALPGAALAQCNPTLPGSCAPNNPVLFGLQQEQQSRDIQQREIMMQQQKLQQIERENVQRYQLGEQNAVRSNASDALGLPQIIAPDPPRRPRGKAVRRHRARAHHKRT